MSVSDSDQESINSSSSKEGEVWKKAQLFNFINDYGSKKLKQHKESFLNLDDCINPNYNYEFLCSRFVSQPKSNKKFESPTQKDLVPITFGELIPEDEICKKTLDIWEFNEMTYVVPQCT